MLYAIAQYSAARLATYRPWTSALWPRRSSRPPGSIWIWAPTSSTTRTLTGIPSSTYSTALASSSSRSGTASTRSASSSAASTRVSVKTRPHSSTTTPWSLHRHHNHNCYNHRQHINRRKPSETSRSTSAAWLSSGVGLVANSGRRSTSRTFRPTCRIWP